MSYAVSFAYIGRHLSGHVNGPGTAPIALSAAQIITATGLTALAMPLGGLRPVHLELGAVLSGVGPSLRES